MRFAHPDMAWLLLLLPALAGFAWWALRRRRRDLERFADPAVAERLTRSVSAARQRWKSGLLVAGFGSLLVALTGPQFGVRLEMAERRGVDVMLVLDLSRSMLAEDVKPSRLERARRVAGELLDQLEGDRVGLVVFADNAFVQCPLTLDHGAVRMLLSQVNPDDLPAQGSSLARALDAAADTFDPDDRQFKAVVVLGDGETHTGDAVAAAQRLAAAGARLYCVGMGTPEGGLIPVRAEDGTQLENHKDRQGNYVKTRLDEAGLRQVAAAGEGAYWRVQLGRGVAGQVADRIAGLEEKELGAERFTRFEERYRLPLAVALACFLGEALLSERARRRRPWQGRFA